MLSKGLFRDIAKFADVNRTQRLCHEIHIFFGSLGKV